MQNKENKKTNLLAPKMTAKKIVLTYSLISILLFALLDKAIFRMSLDSTTLFILESSRNCLFILLSALTLYYLLNLYTEASLELAQQNLQLGQELAARQKSIEKLKHLSIHDKLTGLTNRTYFELQLERLQDELYFPVGVIVCHVEDLKILNDILGCTDSSNLLSAVNLLKKSFAQNISISRIGSSEFVIFFKNTSREEIQSAAAALRENQAAYNKANPASPVYIWLGMAIGEQPTSKIQELLYQADYTLHCDKLVHSKEAHDLFLQAILYILKEHDTFAADHLANLQHLVEKFAKACSLSAQTIQELKWLATFHDIGKIGVPSHIVNKKERLTADEYNEIKKHCNIGYRIARVTPSLMPIADLINKHHEWWNGQGYPLGLKKEQIPLECRVLGIVDAFDAMTSNHSYRTPIPVSAALEEIKKCAGSQFDPDLAEKFIELIQKEVSE